MDREIWDEDRWESFLRETDRQLERYMTLLFQFMRDDPPPRQPGSDNRRAWEDRLRMFLLSNGIRPDDDLPHQFYDTDQRSHPDSDSEPEIEDPVGSLARHAVYHAAHSLETRVLMWSNGLPGHVKDSTLVQFCAYVLQIPSNLAKGHEIGYEMDAIGGNIACSKRALHAANEALILLREIREADYVEAVLYRSVYEELFLVRNGIGIHVQELRDRFRLGID